ncbi:hypothetical protein C8N43_2611 [Litoreibacter ponti]|uniref:O-antigen ligase n=1 Tax=Litoreibacter ponti TaxID=1510457 RepID=A0A2T6BPF3_9RHOB|nr:O-antigen ligase family protein [Litoreibacter ponti]PTX57936.1 hypothetical protein C8N43_2611 [Litoreibacter ponti]
MSPELKPARLPWPVLAYLVAVLLPVRYSIGPLQMTGLRTFLLFAIIPLLVQLFRQKNHPARPIDFLLLTFAAWITIALSQSSPGQAVEAAGSLSLELLGGYLIARVYIQSQEQFQALIKTLFWAILCILPLAIFEARFGEPLLISLIKAVPAISSVDIVDIAPRLGLERVQAVFAHPIHFGLFASTLVALSLFGLPDSSLAFRILAATAGVISSFLALSSGAFLSIILQLFLIGWALSFGTARRSWMTLALICLSAYVLIDIASNRSPIRVFFSYATFSAHNAYWRGIIFEWGMVNVWQNPVFGLGLKEWVRPAFMHSGSMDNFWLVVAVRYGLPGFALLAAAYLFGMARIACAKLPSHLEGYRIGWLICFTGLTFTLCTVHVWTSVFSFVFFLFGAGFWMLKDQSEEAQPETVPRFLPYSRFSELA